MAFSVQTNTDSLVAQENLRVNSEFQSRTIQRLTSGYRINKSGDDAAGLAIANKYRSDVTELTQGVRNANDGISTLQIVDGGMNNITKMLDRLKTLATQSASGTFTGDRSVLNNEFSTLMSEIDRQAQAIGMDSNGTLARSLSVFIGGGRAHGSHEVSTDNGSVTVDLSSSAVDTRSLGLKGMQVVAGTKDIGSASTTSVANILADTGNTTATSGYTDFYFAGPGFSGAEKVKVSVNTSGVTDVDSLVTAINSAIESAGNGTSAAATAMGNAMIVASVNTDANGGKQLAFTSATTAFQVTAGDRMANALMGNMTGTTGTAIGTTLVGAATTAGAFSPTNVTVRISGGGLADPVDLTFDSGSNTTALAIDDLVAKVGANAELQAAGITVSGAAGDPLTFTSARGDKLGVMVTGDTANRLGLGSFVAGAGGAVEYNTITGTAYDNTASYGTASLEVSLNGGLSNGNAVTIDLAGGDATAAVATGTVAGTVADQDTRTVIMSVDGTARTVTFAGAVTTIAGAAAQINTQSVAGGWGVEATLDADGYLVLTSATKGASSEVNITGGTAAAALGLAVADHAGTSRSVGSVVTALNDAFATDAEMQAAGLKATNSGGQVVIASTNGTDFRVNAGGSGANADIGFGVAGASFNAQTINASAISNVKSGGATHSTALTFSALSYGNSDQAVTISAVDPNGAMRSHTITLRNDDTNAYGRSLDDAITYINQQLQQTNNSTLQKIVAVKENVGGAEKINFISSLASFSVSVGASGNAQGINGGAAATFASAAFGDGGNVSIETQAGALAAVSALADAVKVMGTAQAAVGKGQNQLSYALGLAGSQISNYSGAESRIRDADFASEAANLTKGQVLQQASMAATAQANNAPQAVLTLLRG